MDAMHNIGGSMEVEKVDLKCSENGSEYCVFGSRSTEFKFRVSSNEW